MPQALDNYETNRATVPVTATSLLVFPGATRGAQPRLRPPMAVTGKDAPLRTLYL